MLVKLLTHQGNNKAGTRHTHAHTDTHRAQRHRHRPPFMARGRGRVIRVAQSLWPVCSRDATQTL